MEKGLLYECNEDNPSVVTTIRALYQPVTIPTTHGYHTSEELEFETCDENLCDEHIEGLCDATTSCAGESKKSISLFLSDNRGSRAVGDKRAAKLACPTCVSPIPPDIRKEECHSISDSLSDDVFLQDSLPRGRYNINSRFADNPRGTGYPQNCVIDLYDKQTQAVQRLVHYSDNEYFLDKHSSDCCATEQRGGATQLANQESNHSLDTPTHVHNHVDHHSSLTDQRDRKPNTQPDTLIVTYQSDSIIQPNKQPNNQLYLIGHTAPLSRCVSDSVLNPKLITSWTQFTPGDKRESSPCVEIRTPEVQKENTNAESGCVNNSGNDIEFDTHVLDKAITENENKCSENETIGYNDCNENVNNGETPVTSETRYENNGANNLRVITSGFDLAQTQTKFVGNQSISSTTNEIEQGQKVNRQSVNKHVPNNERCRIEQKVRTNEPLNKHVCEYSESITAGFIQPHLRNTHSSENLQNKETEAERIVNDSAYLDESQKENLNTSQKSCSKSAINSHVVKKSDIKKLEESSVTLNENKRDRLVPRAVVQETRPGCQNTGSYKRTQCSVCKQILYPTNTEHNKTTTAKSTTTNSNTLIGISVPLIKEPIYNNPNTGKTLKLNVQNSEKSPQVKDGPVPKEKQQSSSTVYFESDQSGSNPDTQLSKTGVNTAPLKAGTSSHQDLSQGEIQVSNPPFRSSLEDFEGYFEECENSAINYCCKDCVAVNKSDRDARDVNKGLFSSCRHFCSCVGSALPIATSATVSATVNTTPVSYQHHIPDCKPSSSRHHDQQGASSDAGSGEDVSSCCKNNRSAPNIIETFSDKQATGVSENCAIISSNISLSCQYSLHSNISQENKLNNNTMAVMSNSYVPYMETDIDQFETVDETNNVIKPCDTGQNNESKEDKVVSDFMQHKHISKADLNHDKLTAKRNLINKAMDENKSNIDQIMDKISGGLSRDKVIDRSCDSGHGMDISYERVDTGQHHHHLAGSTLDHQSRDHGHFGPMSVHDVMMSSSSSLSTSNNTLSEESGEYQLDPDSSSDFLGDFSPGGVEYGKDFLGDIPEDQEETSQRSMSSSQDSQKGLEESGSDDSSSIGEEMGQQIVVTSPKRVQIGAHEVITSKEYANREIKSDTVTITSQSVVKTPHENSLLAQCNRFNTNPDMNMNLASIEEYDKPEDNDLEQTIPLCSEGDESNIEDEENGFMEWGPSFGDTARRIKLHPKTNDKANGNVSETVDTQNDAIKDKKAVSFDNNEKSHLQTIVHAEVHQTPRDSQGIDIYHTQTDDILESVEGGVSGNESCQSDSENINRESQAKRTASPKSSSVESSPEMGSKLKTDSSDLPPSDYTGLSVTFKPRIQGRRAQRQAAEQARQQRQNCSTSSPPGSPNPSGSILKNGTAHSIGIRREADDKSTDSLVAKYRKKDKVESLSGSGLGFRRFKRKGEKLFQRSFSEQNVSSKVLETSQRTRSRDYLYDAQGVAKTADTTSQNSVASGAAPPVEIMRYSEEPRLRLGSLNTFESNTDVDVHHNEQEMREKDILKINDSMSNKQSTIEAGKMNEAVRRAEVESAPDSAQTDRSPRMSDNDRNERKLKTDVNNDTSQTGVVGTEFSGKVITDVRNEKLDNGKHASNQVTSNDLKSKISLQNITDLVSDQSNASCQNKLGFTINEANKQPTSNHVTNKNNADSHTYVNLQPENDLKYVDTLGVAAKTDGSVRPSDENEKKSAQGEYTLLETNETCQVIMNSPDDGSSKLAAQPIWNNFSSEKPEPIVNDSSTQVVSKPEQQHKFHEINVLNLDKTEQNKDSDLQSREPTEENITGTDMGGIISLESRGVTDTARMGEQRHATSEHQVVQRRNVNNDDLPDNEMKHEPDVCTVIGTDNNEPNNDHLRIDSTNNAMHHNGTKIGHDTMDLLKPETPNIGSGSSGTGDSEPEDMFFTPEALMHAAPRWSRPDMDVSLSDILDQSALSECDSRDSVCSDDFSDAFPELETNAAAVTFQISRDSIDDLSAAKSNGTANTSVNSQNASIAPSKPYNERHNELPRDFVRDYVRQEISSRTAAAFGKVNTDVNTAKKATEQQVQNHAHDVVEANKHIEQPVQKLDFQTELQKAVASRQQSLGNGNDHDNEAPPYSPPVASPSHRSSDSDNAYFSPPTSPKKTLNASIYKQVLPGAFVTKETEISPQPKREFTPKLPNLRTPQADTKLVMSQTTTKPVTPQSTVNSGTSQATKQFTATTPKTSQAATKPVTSVDNTRNYVIENKTQKTVTSPGVAPAQSTVTYTKAQSPLKKSERNDLVEENNETEFKTASEIVQQFEEMKRVQKQTQNPTSSVRKMPAYAPLRAPIANTNPTMVAQDSQISPTPPKRVQIHQSADQPLSHSTPQLHPIKSQETNNNYDKCDDTITLKELLDITHQKSVKTTAEDESLPYDMSDLDRQLQLLLESFSDTSPSHTATTPANNSTDYYPRAHYDSRSHYQSASQFRALYGSQNDSVDISDSRPRAYSHSNGHVTPSGSSTGSRSGNTPDCRAQSEDKVLSGYSKGTQKRVDSIDMISQSQSNQGLATTPYGYQGDKTDNHGHGYYGNGYSNRARSSSSSSSYNTLPSQKPYKANTSVYAYHAKPYTENTDIENDNVFSPTSPPYSVTKSSHPFSYQSQTLGRHEYRNKSSDVTPPHSAGVAMPGRFDYGGSDMTLTMEMSSGVMTPVAKQRARMLSSYDLNEECTSHTLLRMRSHLGKPVATSEADLVTGASKQQNKDGSGELAHSTPRFVRDTSRLWYKAHISRDEAITMLKDRSAGSFVVRDSNSFPGAYGLAVKVSHVPPNVVSRGDPDTELVRHFLIEPTANGVKLKGCSNEPVFGTLAALVYQHTITPLALPCKLILPDPGDVVDGIELQHSPASNSQLLAQGAACNVLFLNTVDMESLTGPEAVAKAISLTFSQQPHPKTTVVHFKVNLQGITLTDNKRRLFFRRHYAVAAVTYCGLDPEDRKWTPRSTDEAGAPPNAKLFGFVARKAGGSLENQCHVFAEFDPQQPASAIVNFVTKVMIGQNKAVKS